MTNLQDVRLAQGKSINEISHKIGIAPKVLRDYEDNERPIPPGDIECINYYLKLRRC